MGYIYEKVKSVISSNSSSNGGHVISNWSPNMYRCIVLGPSFIFVAKHIGVPQIIDMDMQKVKEDLINYSKGTGRGSLHNLLAERQLSCLEEIYIDNCYKHFTNLIDLENYIGKVKNSVSRLRYYGYCTVGMSATWLVSAFSNCDVIYSLAKDKSRVFPLEYKEVGVQTWYKNYNLRPMYYKMDSDRGQLAIYFRKNENIIEEAIKKLGESEKSAKENEVIKKRVELDMRTFGTIGLFLKAINYLNNPSYTDLSVDVVFTCIKEELRKQRSVKGLTKEKITRVFGQSTDIERIVKYYTMFKVFSEDSSLEVSDSDYGFFNIEELLDNICVAVADKLYSYKDTREIIALNLKIHKNEFPKGKLSEKYFSGNTSGTVDGYIALLSDIIGTDISTL